MRAFDLYFGPLDDMLDLDIGYPEIMEIIAAPTDQRRWSEFALKVVREVWMALPASLRQDMRSAIGLIIKFVEEAVIEAIGPIIGTLTSTLEAFPLIGAVIKMVGELVGQIVDAVRDIKAIYTAWSGMQKNIEQLKTFYYSGHPTQWVAALLHDFTYPYYESKSSDRINNMKWRRRPCISPSWRDSAVWGLGHAERPEGNCLPGRALKVTAKMNLVQKWPESFENRSGTSCSSECAVSCLFFPFWSTNHPAVPLRVYAGGGQTADDDVVVDPNILLMERQTALLADPLTNLSASGAAVRRAHDAFVRYFKDQLLFAGLWPVNEDGMISSPQRFAIASGYNVEEEHTLGAPKFYWGSDGTIRMYAARPGETPPDVALYGVPALGPENPGSTWTSDKRLLAYTVGAFNAVVRASKAFFHARRSFLLNVWDIRMLIDYRPDMNIYDPDIHDAMREVASGPALPRQPVPAPRPMRFR